MKQNLVTALALCSHLMMMEKREKIEHNAGYPLNVWNFRQIVSFSTLLRWPSLTLSLWCSGAQSDPHRVLPGTDHALGAGLEFLWRCDGPSKFLCFSIWFTFTALSSPRKGDRKKIEGLFLLICRSKIKRKKMQLTCFYHFLLPHQNLTNLGFF